MLNIISLLALLLISGHASAEQVLAQSALPSISDARALIEQGQDNDAIGALGQLLKNSPDNFQAWFLLGVTQAKQRRFHDAVLSFGKVVALQPKLAEPHNNLAVIYNELGDFRAAVKELEASLKLKPDYATAHENIGDLYVKLAADAYRKALKKDGRPALRQRYDRLLHIRGAHKTELATASETERPDAPDKQAPDQRPNQSVAGGQPTEQPIAQRTTKQASATQATTLATEKKPVAKQAGSENNNPIQVVQAGNVQPKAVVQAAVLNGDKKDNIVKKPAASGRDVKATEPQDATRSAMAAVEAWRSAWNRQDMSAYFAAYSDAFDFGPRFETLQQWKHYKQWAITKRTFIRVTLENIEAKILPDGEIRLVFLQHFRSDSFNSDDIKEMLLRQSQDGWKIIHEASQ